MLQYLSTITEQFNIYKYYDVCKRKIFFFLANSYKFSVKTFFLEPLRVLCFSVCGTLAEPYNKVFLYQNVFQALQDNHFSKSVPSTRTSSSVVPPGEPFRVYCRTLPASVHQIKGSTV